jgi:hypothetical protein
MFGEDRYSALSTAALADILFQSDILVFSNDVLSLMFLADKFRYKK